MSESQSKFCLCLFLFLSIAVSRFLQLAISPTFGLVLLTGYLVKPQSLAVAITLLAVLFTDFFFGFSTSSILGYPLYAAMIFLSPGTASTVTILRSSVVVNILFFFISNFAVWVDGRLYPLTSSGLWGSYVFALPFFERSLIGTILFSFIFIKAAYAYKPLKNFHEA